MSRSRTSVFRHSTDGQDDLRAARPLPVVGFAQLVLPCTARLVGLEAQQGVVNRLVLALEKGFNDIVGGFQAKPVGQSEAHHALGLHDLLRIRLPLGKRRGHARVSESGRCREELQLERLLLLR